MVPAKPKVLPAKNHGGTMVAASPYRFQLAAYIAYPTTGEKLGRAWQQKIDGGTRRLCVKHEMPWMERFEKEEAEKQMHMEDGMSGGASS